MPRLTRGKSLALSLLKGRYAARSAFAMAMDDLVVHSLFTKVDVAKFAPPQTLSVAFAAPGEALVGLYEAFEEEKRGFLSCEDGKGLLELANRVLVRLQHIGGGEYFKYLSTGEEKLLTWILAIYSLLLGGSSTARLRCVPMGPDRRYGFGLFARRKIPAGTELWDILGLMPTDNLAPTTELSMITVAAGQSQKPGSERVLFGSMRMLNHRCKSFNSEFLFKKKSSLYALHVNVDVEQGEELTVNYGEAWFGGDCPCTDCFPLPPIPDAPAYASVAQASVAEAAPSPALQALQRRDEILASAQAEKERLAEEFRVKRKRMAGERVNEKADRKRLKQASRRQGKTAKKRGDKDP